MHSETASSKHQKYAVEQFPRTVFICIRLTSAFSYPPRFFLRCTSKERERERGREKMVERRRKRNVGSGWLKRDRSKKVHSFSSSSSSSSSFLSLSPSPSLFFFFLFFAPLATVTKHRSFAPNYQSSFLTETRFPFMRTEPARVFLTGIEKGQRTLTESPLRLNQQLWHNTQANVSVKFVQREGGRERKRERECVIFKYFFLLIFGQNKHIFDYSYAMILLILS